MKPPGYLLPTLLSLSLWLPGCTSNSSKTEETTTTAPPAGEMPVGTDKRSATMVQAVEMTASPIPGYRFPEDSSIINGWIKRRDAASIDRHAWGVWTTLSAYSRQITDGDTLRVYETWPTADEVDEHQKKAGPEEMTMLLQRPRPTRRLSVPKQLFRDPTFLRRLSAKSGLSAHAMAPNSMQPVFESVAYNPAAATFITQNKLFWASTLQGMLDRKQADIPQLPRQSIAIKPVYEVVPGRRGAPLYEMKVWTGTTTARTPYDQDKWKNTVYVDIRNRGRGQGQVGAAGAAPTAATTYNLRDFISFKLTAAEAAALNSQRAGMGDTTVVYPGDYAILVAMHITTKEIKRWTWQTMWWAPDYTNLPLPSSRAIATHRPKELVGAPRHYAMAIAYQMIDPVQPFAGGKSVGRSIYAFNPYLEAGFDSTTFWNASHLKEPSRVLTNSVWVNNNVGVRTNCMSCHAQASFTSLEAIKLKKMLPLGYLGNTYVDMGSPKFRNRLRTDFLWSIADRASRKPDSDK